MRAKFKKFLKLVKDQYFLISLILLVGFVARLYKIGNPVADWHSWRQADTASVSRIYLDEGIDIRYPRYYDVSRIQTGAINLNAYRLVEFPIYNVLHAIAAKNIQSCPKVNVPGQPIARAIYFYFFPDNVDLASLGTPCFEIVGRLISIISSLFSAFLLFLIGRKLYGKGAGILAVFLFSILPYNIYFSRTILPDPLGITFALGGIYFFIKFIYDANKWFLYLSGLSFAAALLIKPFNAFYLVPVLYLSYKHFSKDLFREANILIRYLIFTFLVVAPFSAWRIWINKYPIGIPHFEWMFNGDGIRGRPAFWYWIFGERIGKLILGVWMVIPLYLGLLKSRKSLFAHFWVLGMIFYVAIVATANVRHDYYQMIIVAPLALVTAIGLTTAKGKLEKGALAILVILGIFVGGFQAKEFYKINHPEILVAGRAVQKIIPYDFMIIAPYNGDTAFLYQTGRYGWPVVDEPIERMVKRGASYFVAVNFADPDVAYVEKNFRILEKTDQYIIADLLRGPK